jgi:hypothetical protein
MIAATMTAMIAGIATTAGTATIIEIATTGRHSPAELRLSAAFLGR